LARLFVARVLGESKQQQIEQRKREGYERSMMLIEDTASLEQEMIYRSDKDLHKRLAEARQQRIKEEKQRMQNKKLNAIVTMQKHIRGK
jgi:hypothetical protein